MYKQFHDEKDHVETDERLDEPWEESQETLIQGWRSSCESLAARHEEAAKAAKKKAVRYGLPAIILSLIHI